MKKKIMILTLIILMIFSFITTSFCVDDSIMPLSIDDEFGLYDILESIIVEKTGYSASDFDGNTRFTYIVCKEPNSVNYHIFAAYFYITQYNSSYPVLNPISTSNLDMRIKVNREPNYLKYFTINGDNFSDCSDVVSKNITTGTYTINDLFGVNVFNYLNLLFVNKSNLSFFKQYFYNSFTQRVDLQYPAVDVLDVDLSTAEYYTIAPMDLYMRINSTYIVYNFELNIYKTSSTDGVDGELVYTFNLSHSSNFWFNDDLIFMIPMSTIKYICSQNGNGYYYTDTFVTTNGARDLQSSWYYDSTNDSIDGSKRPSGDISGGDNTGNLLNTVTTTITESNDKVINAINEQNETNKGIFETIKSIVNFLNPFSKDFFVYQLIELLINMLKSLFVPSDDFFSNWFNDLNSWLGDRFGILYFPVEIVLDFLNRIGSMSVNSDYILHIPNVSIDFFGNNVIFISSFDYDFNSLLTNDTFKNIHTIYLTIVDVILYLCLIVLSYNTFVDVFGGHYIDDALHDGYDYYESSKIQTKQEKQSNYIGFRGKGQ